MMSFKEFIAEAKELDDDFVLNALADKDINAKIEGGKVLVDKDDVKQAQSIIKKIGCGKKVEGSLNK